MTIRKNSLTRKLSLSLLVSSLLPIAASAAGTSITVNGGTVDVTGPRAITWSSYLGINTDFTDQTNPLAFPAPYTVSLDYVKQELDYLQALGITWIREPMRWPLELTRGDYVSVLEPNIVPIYNEVKSRGLKIDYQTAGAPCWAEGGLVPGCPALTGTMKVGMTDTIAPMTDLVDWTAFFQYLSQTLPAADVFEIWNEQNISSFWQHQTAVTPASKYTATQLISDYLQVYDAAKAGAPGRTVSAGGFAYTSTMDCLSQTLPSGCRDSQFFANFPKDIKYCYDKQGAPSSACSYPDASKTYYENNIKKYAYHMLNGIAPAWAAAPPQIGQFHPYVDFQPGQAGYAESYLLNTTTHMTAQMRGQEGVHISSNAKDTSASAFTWLNIPQIWAGEFGLSAESYANGTACASATDRLTCGETAQATYSIRYIALMSAMDVDRMMFFDLSDFADPNYLTSNDTGFRDAHYGLLRYGSTPTPKPLYTALQRLLAITGPSITPSTAMSFNLNGGSMPLFTVRWDKPNGRHLMMFWAPDQAATTLNVTNFPATSATLHQVLSSQDTALTATGGALSLPVKDDMQILEW
jgi:hypothetical protein